MLLSYATDVRWFFQRYRDRLEPPPQVPRGWYIFQGYSAQRQIDKSPGISTPASQNLDVAALYFLEPAGRGGFGGYLASDQSDNEYLLGNANKVLIGYPLDGVAEGDQGKLHATPANNVIFSKTVDNVYSTEQIRSFPGNSGGPLCVENSDGFFHPAAIYLGGSGETLVRAINSEVVDLINRAEISGNGGGNNTGGGVSLLSPGITAPPFGTGLLTVSLTPLNVMNIRPGWRISQSENTNFITDASATVALIGGGAYSIEFKPVLGYVAPSNRIVQLTIGQMVTLQVVYDPILPSLRYNYASGLSLQGAVGSHYRVDYAGPLATPITWTPLTNFTLMNSSLTISNTRPASTGARFYRAVLLP